ncbi:MAG: Gldg family protein [Lachnospiraceae bacterium]|nr:Gldg family protein [Lachnospiraceae bacterium]
MIAVFKREFKACFNGVIGWLFMAVILALFGLYFFVFNLLNGYPYLSYTLSSMTFIMLIAVPALTMRVLSEERRNRTDQLTLTSPVSVWKIVLGKYLALAALFTIDMLIICITPLVMSLYGTVPMGENYTAILGFWLYGLTCIAIGVFVSGITESQIIAAISTFVVLFIGYMMPNFCTLISEEGNILTKILSCYDLYSSIGPFNAGTLDLTCVVYFITVTCIALFLAVQVIEKRRWSMSVRRIGLGVFSITTILAVIAIGVLINFGVRKIPTEYTSLDVTYNKMFAITDETKEYIKNLDEDITIYVWQAEGTADTTLAETLERYEDISKRIRVEYISTVDNPTFYTAYTSEAPANNSLIVVSDKRSRVISYEDIYVYSYDYQTYAQSIDAYDAEGQITSAIEYVTMDEELLPKVYVLEGHDEVVLGQGFTEAMAKANITSETLNLLTLDAVPDDCQLLIINGAMKDISKDDAQKISDYIGNGGDVLMTTSYDAGMQPNLESIMSEFGITRSEGIVMDYDAGHIYSKVAYYLLPDVLDSIYTQNISNGYVFTPYAAGLKVDDINSEEFGYTEMFVTSDEAVTVKVGENTDAENAETTDKGPFYIGLSAIRSDKPGTLIVIGSIDIFTDEADSIVAGSNLSLFNAILSQHVSAQEGEEVSGNLPVIAAKQYTVDNLVINSAVGTIVGLFIMIILPIAMIAVGIAIWASRRKR